MRVFKRGKSLERLRLPNAFLNPTKEQMGARLCCIAICCNAHHVYPMLVDTLYTSPSIEIAIYTGRLSLVVNECHVVIV